MKLKAYIRSIILLVGILILSIMPSDSNNELPRFWFQGMDKIIHLGMYFLLTLSFLRDHYKNKQKKPLITFLIALGILLFSLCMELIQHYLIYTRSGDILDALANLSGILIALLIYHLILRPQ
jgi:glycopeptide antibiotics resistance protein